MPNVYDSLAFDALPAAELTKIGDKLRINAPAIHGVEEGQEVVFFIRTPLGHGIAIYVTLLRSNLKQPIVVEIEEKELPKSKVLHIDYGAYINKRAVHRSAVADYPASEDTARG